MYAYIYGKLFQKQKNTGQSKAALFYISASLLNARLVSRQLGLFFWLTFSLL